MFRLFPSPRRRPGPSEKFFWIPAFAGMTLSMYLRIYTKEQGIIALNVLAKAGVSATFVFGVGMHDYAGLPYVKRMFGEISVQCSVLSVQKKTESRIPNPDPLFLLDISDNAALALAAIKLGFTHVAFDGPAEVFEKLQKIYTASGKTLYDASWKKHPVLDLAGETLMNEENTTQRVRDWVEGALSVNR